MQYSFNRREPIFQYERDASRHTRAHVHAHTHTTHSRQGTENARLVGEMFDNTALHECIRVETERCINSAD